MALQNTFYILGIICMTLMLFILIGIVVMLFFIKKKITEMHKSVVDTLESVQHTAHRITDVAGSFGVNAAGTVVEGVKALIKHRQGKKG
jgi:hypothetical protein